MSRNDKLWGLALTAAMEIVSHDEVAITLHGSTAINYTNDPVGLLRVIIYDTINAGLNYKPPKPLTVGPNQDTLEGSDTTKKEG